MDNRDYEELDEEELEEESDEESEQLEDEDSEEMSDYDEPEEDYSDGNSGNNFNNQNLQNKLRDLRNRNKQNQNTADKLNQRQSNTMNKGVEAPKSTSSVPKAPPTPTPAVGTAAGGAATAGGAAAGGAAAGTAAAGGAAAGGAAASGGAALLANPYVLAAVIIIIVIIILVIMIPILFGASDGDSSGSDSSGSGNSNPSSNVDSMISLTKTNLSKDEFIAACDSYATVDSKHKYFYDKCGEIYEISIDNNFNPEMVVIRAIVEGFSPGSSRNNYWGLGCYNGAGVNACISYSSFAEGVKGFIKNVSQYDTVEQMMGRYAYIGHNWYNPGSSSDGGCYYYPYIKKYMSSNRILTVDVACSDSRRCSGTMCEATNDEDQLAYSKWQVSKMVDVGNNVFGSVTSQEATPAASSSEMPTSVADLKNRYYFTFDKDSYLGYEKNNNHLFGQCVWYAYHRAMDIVNSSDLSEEEKQKRINSLKTHSGDGGMYVTNMESAVFKKVTNINDIKAPAVISWKNNSYGHVGIVEEIKTDSNGNKIFVVSEGWRTRDCPDRSWCTHNSLESLWAVTNFNSYTSQSVSTYSGSYTFVNAASLLE